MALLAETQKVQVQNERKTNTDVRQETVVPVLAFGVDGVLANSTKALLELLPEPSYDWTSLASYEKRRIENDTKSVKSKTAGFYESIPAFTDVDFEGLSYQIAGGEFLANFIDCRENLHTGDRFSDDAGYSTRQWFAKNGLTEANVISDVSPDLVPFLLNILHCSAFLTDDPLLYERISSSKTRPYLINRPWNREPHCRSCRRVGSVNEFVDAALAEHDTNQN